MFFICILTRTAVKYIGKTMDKISREENDADLEDCTILEQMLRRGLSAEDAVVLTLDLLMAGIDTVFNYPFLQIRLYLINYLGYANSDFAYDFFPVVLLSTQWR